MIRDGRFAVVQRPCFIGSIGREADACRRRRNLAMATGSLEKGSIAVSRKKKLVTRCVTQPSLRMGSVLLLFR